MSLRFFAEHGAQRAEVRISRIVSARSAPS
jgi:hypothetical protein